MIYADTTRYQGFPRIISDGKGGIIAAFLQGNTAQDARVYAQRVGPAGDLLWPRERLWRYSPDACTEWSKGPVRRSSLRLGMVMCMPCRRRYRRLARLL